MEKKGVDLLIDTRKEVNNEGARVLYVSVDEQKQNCHYLC
jgi:hypothetical protein